MTVDESATKLVDDLANLLDATFERWDFWRTASKEWVIRVESKGQLENFSSSSVIEAMRLASVWKPLPLVPRRVFVLNQSLFTQKKIGNKWKLEYEGKDWGGLHDSKKKAVDFSNLLVARYASAAAEWTEKHSWALHKVEGVDFRWAS